MAAAELGQELGAINTIQVSYQGPCCFPGFYNGRKLEPEPCYVEHGCLDGWVECSLPQTQLPRRLSLWQREQEQQQALSSAWEVK